MHRTISFITIIIFCICFYNGVSQVTSKLNVAGTKVIILPPDGFTPASKFFGYENLAYSASIFVNEMPIPFVEQQYNEENFRKQGMTLVAKEEVALQNQKAFLFNLNQKAQGIEFKKYSLIFGDSNKTVMIVGVFPKSVIEVDSIIKTSLLTAEYDERIIIDSLANFNFTIDIVSKGYKQAIILSGTLGYTLDGNLPTKSEGKEVFLVANSFGKVAFRDIKDYTVERFKKLPYSQKWEIKHINEVTIDKLSGYEIIAYESIGNEEVKVIYFVMLFDIDEYYIFNGSAANNMDDNLKIFKEAANSFKRK